MNVRKALWSLVLVIVVGGCATGTSSSATATATASGSESKAAVMQLRRVLEVSGLETPGDSGLQVTCGVGAATPCTPDQLVSVTPLVLQDADGTRYRLDAPVVDGADVVSAEASRGSDGWIVNFELSPGATTRFTAITTQLAALPQGDPTRRIAIVADGIVVSVPAVQGPVTSGSGQISGGLTRTQADALATELGGASP